MKPAVFKLWRQGDVLIQGIAALPKGFCELGPGPLFSGVASGHHHQLKDRKSARIGIDRGLERYLEVLTPGAEIIHPEHATIPLPAGSYRLWQQREYADAKSAPRPVAD